MAYDDYEQSERVRQWIRDNGLAVILGIVVGLAVIFGYRWWSAHQANQRIEAATQYQLISSSIRSGHDSEAKALTSSLVKNHPDSTYALFAMMLQAKQQQNDGHIDKAEQSIQWAVQHAKGPLKDLSLVRLARLQWHADKSTQALQALAKIPDGNFTGIVEALRGDIKSSMGDSKAALAAYKKALTHYEPATPEYTIIQVKMDNLSIAKVKTSTPTESDHGNG